MMKPENVKVAVIGAGVMGHGIAQTFAQGGCRVAMVDTTREALDRGVHLIRSSLETLADESLLEEPIETILSRITCTTSIEEGARNAELAVEVVTEDASLKKEIFRQLDASCPPQAILASNTSFLNIFEIADAYRPEKLVITHWYTPPQLIPLVDVAGGPRTDPVCLEWIVNILKLIGKKPVLMKKWISGYAINRIQLALQREVHYLLDNGFMSVEQIDEAAKFGLAFRMMVVGVMQRFDFGGIDLSVRNFEGHNSKLTPPDYNPKTLYDLFEKGHFGVKTGKGFYDYTGKTEAEIYRERDHKLVVMLKYLKETED